MPLMDDNAVRDHNRESLIVPMGRPSGWVRNASLRSHPNPRKTIKLGAKSYLRIFLDSVTIDLFGIRV
jgi:hypothetical protein